MSRDYFLATSPLGRGVFFEHDRPPSGALLYPQLSSAPIIASSDHFGAPAVQFACSQPISTKLGTSLDVPVSMYQSRYRIVS